MSESGVVDDFDGEDLDPGRWVRNYLPQWSSRAESAATYVVEDSMLRLSIPPDQGLWCAASHDPPLRVSGVQSGVHSGRVGSTIGQQPFLPGQTVREEQTTRWGWTPRLGLIEVRARMDLTGRSMASVWLVGIEDEPSRSGEICLFEVFGDAIAPDGRSAEVGGGVHPFRDPALTEDFEAPWREVDVRDFHVYGADWHPDRVDLLVDSRVVRSVDQSPAYPMQMMIAVFDFPDRAQAGQPPHTPRLDVAWVRGATPAGRGATG
jgi:hypothetical protein